MSTVLCEKAVEYVKNNKRLIIDKFASILDYPKSDNPFTIFMAGSPGAGKTEFSKSWQKILFDKDKLLKCVRIDADEIRDILPQFNHKNSDEVQRAAVKGVEILFDHVQNKRINTIVDGTFANYDVSRKDVERALGRKREVEIIYLYQDPMRAWEFTKARSLLVGRSVPKSIFIKAFFSSKENVNKIKEEFKKDVKLTLAIKDFANGIEKTLFNIDSVDSYLKIEYTIGSLKKLLK